MKVSVNAKLNLTLNVLGVKGGFHNIDSVVTSVDVCDVVEVTPRSDGEITVVGFDRVKDENNSAYKAACAFKTRFSTCGANITISKGIPVGAGMGGSSADAAAAIYCMGKLYGIDVYSPAVHGLCAELGSDVNFMLRGGIARLSGKGDDVEFGVLAEPLFFVLTEFGTSMSTAEVYSRFDNVDTSNLVFTDNAALIDVLKRATPSGISECFNNHLQIAASGLSAYAQNYLSFCKNNDLLCNMTGSGSAYYVAFNNEAQARQTVKLLNGNGFKTVLCRSVPCGIKEL